MATTNKALLTTDMALENLAAKIDLLQTGSITVTGTQAIFNQRSLDGHWGGVANSVESYMHDRLINVNGGNLVKTVGEVLKNATGQTLTDAQVQTAIDGYIGKGVNTWVKFFTELVEVNQDPNQLLLDTQMQGKLAAFGSLTNQGAAADVALAPAIAAAFIDPATTAGGINGALSYQQLSTMTFTEGGRAGAPVFKTYAFDAPMLTSGAVGGVPYIIFDFAGGDKTLAIAESQFSGVFGFSKNVFFLNFNAGDKLLFVDDASTGLGDIIDSRPSVFVNTTHSFDENQSVSANRYNPANGGVDQQTTHLVYTSTMNQLNGDLVVFPFGGTPPELVSAYTDQYGHLKPGVEYYMNLIGTDIVPDGHVTLIGTHVGFDSSNFVVNSTTYTV